MGVKEGKGTGKKQAKSSSRLKTYEKHVYDTFGDIKLSHLVKSPPLSFNDVLYVVPDSF